MITSFVAMRLFEAAVSTTRFCGNATMSDVYFLNSSKFSILEIRDQRFIKTSEVGQVIIKKIEDVSTDLVYVANSALL